jgi:hypothetical protein
VEEREEYTRLNAMWSGDEFSPALSRMKHYKAAGEDGIVAEFMKIGDKKVHDCVLLLLNAVWRLECCPVRWTRAMAWPIYKAGARSEPSNYRLITLLSVVCKVFERWRFKTHPVKSQVMCCCETPAQRGSRAMKEWWLMNQSVKEVLLYVYLGIIPTIDIDFTQHIKVTLQAAHRQGREALLLGARRGELHPQTARHLIPY